MNWVQMIDWLAEGQALSEQEAETLFSAVFDGGMPELEMGALLALLQQRPVSRNELHGALSALGTRVFQAPLPALQWRPVLMPAYGAARSHPNLAPLLALSLQRLGIPVLAHGALSGEGGVSSAYLFRELGVMPVASLAQAQQVLAAGRSPLCPPVRFLLRWPICWPCARGWAAVHWRACWHVLPILSAAARCSCCPQSMVTSR